jgi:hypothetical protein
MDIAKKSDFLNGEFVGNSDIAKKWSKWPLFNPQEQK